VGYFLHLSWIPHPPPPPPPTKKLLNQILVTFFSVLSTSIMDPPNRASVPQRRTLTNSCHPYCPWKIAHKWTRSLSANEVRSNELSTKQTVTKRVFNYL
jgi:hypothetical protein